MTIQHHHRTCSLCDALCRLRITHEDGVITRIEGVPDDPFSQGHICPKAVALKDLQDDPDRLRVPLRRTATGFQEVSWDEALDEAARRIAAVRTRHGKDAVAVYAGNPNAHHFGNLFGLTLWFAQLDTRARFSAQSVDNLPHLFAGLHMFGHALRFGVPDIDHTDHLLVLGANPWVSNGGGMSSGHVRRRIEALRARGGRMVVIDPRRTETARQADAHHFLRPGTDALLLLAMIRVLFDEELVDAGPWRDWSKGIEVLADVAARFPPERVEAATTLSADTIRELTRAFAAAPRATLYARMGACTQAYGGLTIWLVNAFHALTGNLDRPGGLMFAQPVVDTPGLVGLVGGATGYEPDQTAGLGLPRVADELPLAALAGEIRRDDDRRVRALLTVAGNPVLSAPNGPQLEAALGELDVHVAVSLYLDETARTADLILPASAPLEKAHYPLGLASITVRTIASFSEPLYAPVGARDDWDILSELAVRTARIEGRPLWALAGRLAQRVGPRRILDLLIRLGPHGRWRGGHLDLDTVAASRTTIDVGARQPLFPRHLGTADGKADLAPAVFVADLERLEADLQGGRLESPLVLIGRRQLRSNNSWMHNSERLVRGKARCTLLVHPTDAARHGVAHGDEVRVRSRTGAVEVEVEVTDDIAPGVVSLPHGWGHHREGTRLRVAERVAGVSANDLTDSAFVDRLTGTAAFSGVPVTIASLAAERATQT